MNKSEMIVDIAVVAGIGFVLWKANEIIDIKVLGKDNNTNFQNITSDNYTTSKLNTGFISDKNIILSPQENQNIMSTANNPQLQQAIIQFQALKKQSDLLSTLVSFNPIGGQFLSNQVNSFTNSMQEIINQGVNNQKQNQLKASNATIVSNALQIAPQQILKSIIPAANSSTKSQNSPNAGQVSNTLIRAAQTPQLIINQRGLMI